MPSIRDAPSRRSQVLMVAPTEVRRSGYKVVAAARGGCCGWARALRRGCPGSGRVEEEGEKRCGTAGRAGHARKDDWGSSGGGACQCDITDTGRSCTSSPAQDRSHTRWGRAHRAEGEPIRRNGDFARVLGLPKWVAHATTQQTGADTHLQSSGQLRISFTIHRLSLGGSSRESA